MAKFSLLDDAIRRCVKLNHTLHVCKGEWKFIICEKKDHE